MAYRYMAKTALQWAEEAFGVQVARDTEERGMRVLEEAIELAQSLEVPKDVALKLVERVYRKPPGDPKQELAQVRITLDVATTVCGYTPSRIVSQEFYRIQRLPREHWQERHAKKVDEGVAK